MKPDYTLLRRFTVLKERKKQRKSTVGIMEQETLSSSPELPHPVTAGVSFKLKTNCPLDDGYCLLVAFSRTIWDYSVIIFFTLTS